MSKAAQVIDRIQADPELMAKFETLIDRKSCVDDNWYLTKTSDVQIQRDAMALNKFLEAIK